MASYRPFRPAYRRPARSLPHLERPALPAAVVDAVLRFHDEAQDQGGGRTLLRLSQTRLRRADIRAALGELTERAANVAILWNAREDEIIRVLEAA
ncbi:MAG TPA: hypothetical protein VLI41_04340 [Phenylobacterium sp.]|uniref:hypothetical protein n=1 Tax=Phenylobacterium sp. TaxID=1871053 RepID=UPI002C46F62A|nr:hypothetical protein [Phenylobacterium sp.]HSV02413.1 hypothetical protein [Phenylobacterium sp.]